MSENNEPTRRGFLKSTAAVGAAGLAATQGFASSAPATSDAAADYLRQYAVPRETIDRFLDPTARVWAKYDPTYGYLLRDAFLRDGVDGARTLGRYTQDGPRRQVNFTDEPCRINTYGDSFTQGHQVSDGETWQEVLAAHFCEPIRNYGIGGFGVYQAYRRMLENEATENGADHLVLNIWGDDHHRSVYSCRWLSFPTSILSGMTGAMYHANPWVHARLDPNTDELLEKPNACPNEESLYGLCDGDWLVDTFANDPIIHVLIAIHHGKVSDRAVLEQVASQAGVETLDFSSEDATRVTGRQILNTYAVKVGTKIIDAANAFATANGKRLFVLLSHPSGSVWRHCAKKTASDAGEHDWHPEWFRQHLRDTGVPFVDTVEAHVEDFQRFSGTAREYVDRYYIGHYTPTGNHFFAYAVKDQLAQWLDPPPPAYADNGHETLIRFEGYLPE